VVNAATTVSVNAKTVTGANFVAVEHAHKIAMVVVIASTAPAFVVLDGKVLAVLLDRAKTIATPWVSAKRVSARA